MPRGTSISYIRFLAFSVSVLALVFLSGCSQTSSPSPAPLNQPMSPIVSGRAIAPATPIPPVVAPAGSPALTAPISQALQRITLKTFGLYVSPAHSPVSPERFTGYHTGVDFETLPSEQNAAVNIMAICTGKLLEKKWAAGYGGVAVEACTLEGNPITVIYGHLKLASITPTVGTTLTAGSVFAVLGKGYSTETDGERKHLHLGIHRGTAINILGYVQNSADLSQWLDATKYLK